MNYGENNKLFLENERFFQFTEQFRKLYWKFECSCPDKDTNHIGMMYFFIYSAQKL